MVYPPAVWFISPGKPTGSGRPTPPHPSRPASPPYSSLFSPTHKQTRTEHCLAASILFLLIPSSRPAKRGGKKHTEPQANPRFLRSNCSSPCNHHRFGRSPPPVLPAPPPPAGRSRPLAPRVPISPTSSAPPRPRPWRAPEDTVGGLFLCESPTSPHRNSPGASAIDSERLGSV